MGTIAKTLVTQDVIMSSLVGIILKLLHDTPQAGHPGHDRALSMACAKYYWPTILLDIEKHIIQCLFCAETPILEYPLPARPFNVVGINLLQLPRSIQGSISLGQHFSHFTVLSPLPNKSATTVAHAIVPHLICPYTTPHLLLSDNGREFKNQVLRDVCT